MSFNTCRIFKALSNLRIVTVSVRPVRHINLQTCSLARGTTHVTQGFRSRLPINSNVNNIFTEEARFEDKPPEIISLEKSEIVVTNSKVLSSSPTISSPKLSRPAPLGSPGILPYYQKLGDADKKFSSLMLLLRSKKERERKKLILLEGRRLIQDALDAGVKPHSIFFSRKDSLQNLKFSQDSSKVEIFKLQYKHIQLWSNLTTSPGIVGVFETPKEKDICNISNSDLPVTLVCDNVREPGNLGAILRVAAGVGCHQVLLTKGCIDLWEPKVLRSGAGAHFRVPIQQGIQWEHIKKLVQQEKAAVYLADNKCYANSGLSLCEYSDINFAAEPGQWLLVLGGETEGLSEEAHSLAMCAPRSSKLYIPLFGEVDSLNVAAALAVIMFEMRRQRLSRTSDATTEAAAQ